MISISIIKEFVEVVGEENVLHRREDVLVYDHDAFTIVKGEAAAAVLPASSEEIAKVVKICNIHNLPFLARGAGTSLSGGSIPLENCILIILTKMNHILEVDYDNGTVLVEAGVTNLSVSESVSVANMMYAPDPSSQQVCTIGGNIAHNSGGPHTLKYGVTTNHVLSAEVILPNGEIIEIGSKAQNNLGYDLLGLIIGSDGTLGIVTKALLRILPKPQAIRTFMVVFDDVRDASNTVSELISSGTIPAAIEMMDNLVVRAVEDSIHSAGYPKDAMAVLLVDIDGRLDDINYHSNRFEEICVKNKAREVKIAKNENERKKFWEGRKGAFAAMGRLGTNYIVQDGVIPRTKLPEVLEKVYEISQRHQLMIANVFHAGDGNLHPLIIFESTKEGDTEKAIKASLETLKICADVGGSITGEHGIGVEKRDFMGLIFSNDDLEMMNIIKDVFDPEMMCNPCKALPAGSRCMEILPGVEVPS